MKKAFLVVAFGVIAVCASAQGQDPKSPGFDFGTPVDTTVVQPSGGEEQTPTEPVAKPYVRITLNVDSITNLISYVGVVEQEETGSDSLYIRAKKWTTKKFTGGAKALYDSDKRNQKLVVNGWLPAYSYVNKYNKREVGKYEFKMSIWIKEGRYKYQISNFVHEGIKSNDGNVSRNYFEFYYTAVNNIKGYDQTLRFADKDINAMIEEFKKNMKDPVVLDEEEW